MPVSEGHYEVGWHSAHDAFVAFSETTLGEQHPEDDLSDPDPRDGDGGAGEGIPDIAPDLRVQGAAPAAIGTAAIGQSQSGAEDDAGLRCRWGSLGDR